MRRGCSCCGLREFLPSLFRQGQGHNRNLIAHLILLIDCLSIRHIRSFQHCIARRIFKNEGTRLSQFFQNRIGIGYSGYLNVNPVCTFLIYLRFCRILFHTPLQLINRIVHICG